MASRFLVQVNCRFLISVVAVNDVFREYLLMFRHQSLWRLDFTWSMAHSITVNAMSRLLSLMSLWYEFNSKQPQKNLVQYCGVLYEMYFPNELKCEGGRRLKKQCRTEKFRKNWNAAGFSYLFFPLMAVFEPSVIKSIIKNGIQSIKDRKEFIKNWETHVGAISWLTMEH